MPGPGFQLDYQLSICSTLNCSSTGGIYERERNILMWKFMYSRKKSDVHHYNIFNFLLKLTVNTGQESQDKLIISKYDSTFLDKSEVYLNLFCQFSTLNSTNSGIL